MKVLILSHEYPPYLFGGVAYYTKELAEYLASQGFKVYVVSGLAKKTVVECMDGVRIVRVSFPDVPIRALWYSLASKNIVMKLAEKVDCIILNSGSVGLLPIRLREITKRKKVISIFHGTVYSLIAYFKYTRLREKLEHTTPADLVYYITHLAMNTAIINRYELEISDHIVAVARHVAEELNQLYPSSAKQKLSGMHVVYGGIDYEHLSRIYRSYRESVDERDKIIFAYVGRLYLTKGVHYTLKAFKFIQNELGKEAEIWVFGKGPLERQIINYSKKNNLNMKFFGFISRVKLLKLLAKYASVLLFPSLYEGCPYTLLEVNALGVPVVTWDMLWSKEFMIQGINGYSAKPFSLEELVKYAVQALSLHSEGVRKVAYKFDKKRMFFRFGKLLIEN